MYEGLLSGGSLDLETKAAIERIVSQMLTNKPKKGVAAVLLLPDQIDESKLTNHSF